jgi:uncharacterized protein (DUF1697 family)
MHTYIALLRAINVGGTGKLAMARLRQLCEEAGFHNVRSYIQSGNLVLQSPLSATKVQADLEEILEKELGKPHAVFLRTPQQLQEVLDKNPYQDCQVLFLGQAPAQSMLEKVVAPDGEEVSPGKKEIYVHYPNGMGRSKLKIPGLKECTGRNLNTLRKLLEMAEPG